MKSVFRKSTVCDAIRHTLEEYEGQELDENLIEIIIEHLDHVLFSDEVQEAIENFGG